MIEKIWNIINPVYNAKFNGDGFEVHNWKLSSFIVRKIIPVVGVHPFPLNELQLMVSAVAWAKPTHIFEWGTHIGKSARIFYETCRFLKIETAVHSIDLPDEAEHVEHPHKSRGKLVKGKKNVFLHQGDGVNTSLDIYKSLTGEVRPLFYVDGDHSYESVYRECAAILQNVKNPTIILHDTFYQTAESKYNIGPWQAIADVLAKFPEKKFRRIDTYTGLPGMTLLYL